MPDAFIPFNRAALVGREMEYVMQAVRSGRISGDGMFTLRCHALLEELLGAHKVLLTTSCTDALEMAAVLLDVGPGDEVIVPAFTFVSTINAFVLRGASPVFADIREDTLNLDEKALEGLITERTKVIVPVHYSGVGCEMDEILRLAGERGVHVVEDNANALFGKYRGKSLGTFGCLATQSFHETKLITCGEGGALVLNDPSLVARAEIIREKGTDRSRFFRGETDKYGWVDIGSSHLPSDLLAAFLCAQLECWEEIRDRRRAIWEAYREGLGDWAAGQGVRLPFVPAHCDQAYSSFYLVMPTQAARDGLIAHTRSHGILAVFHYLPLNQSPMGRKLGGERYRCPVSEDISARLVRLPFFLGLSRQEWTRVLGAVCSYRCSA